MTLTIKALRLEIYALYDNIDLRKGKINNIFLCLLCEFSLPSYRSFHHFLTKTNDSVKAARKGLIRCTYDKDRAF